jgi:hypothetical protein
VLYRKLAIVDLDEPLGAQIATFLLFIIALSIFRWKAGLSWGK